MHSQKLTNAPFQPENPESLPFFVATVDGKPDFRIGDPEKIVRCVKESLCWTCGQPLGAFKAFVIGPMCGINRVSAEPPSHNSCATWSVKGCPFLSRPSMVRREDELTEASKANVPGIMIEHSPGISLIWVTREYHIILDPRGLPLFRIGEPMSLSFWREGRPATRPEIDAAIEKGLPKLLECCQGPLDLAALETERQRFETLITQTYEPR